MYCRHKRFHTLFDLFCEGGCVCVCVSGNACGYFISHPWELGATPLCNGLYLCTCTVGTSASIHSLTLKYGLMLKSLDPMEELTASPPYPSWSRTWAWVICPPPPPPPPPHTHTQIGNPGSITEIESTLLSGSAEQDALKMKESPLKNLILFFLRPHPSWGWLQND